MSWFSEFTHNPFQYISDNPLRSLALLAAPLGLGAAAFGGAGLLGGAGAGLFGGGEAAAGLGGAAAGGAAAGAPLDILAGGAGAFAPSAAGDLMLGGSGALGLGAAGESAMLGGAGLDLAGLAGGGAGVAGLTPEVASAFAAAPEGPGAAAGVTSIGGAPGAAGAGGVDALFPGGALGAGAPAGPGAAGGLGAAAGAPIDLASMAAAGGGAAPAAAPAAAGGGGLLSSLGLGGTNPLMAALGAGGLGYSLLQNAHERPSTQALQDEASRANATGTQLTGQGQQYAGYLAQGTLPQGMQQSLDNAVNAQRQQIISGYASRGMPTDPAKNTSLAQDLNALEQRKVAMSGELGQQLLSSGNNLIQSGAQYAGLEGRILQALSGIDQTQTASIGRAIANFTASLGRGGGTTINLGTQRA